MPEMAEVSDMVEKLKGALQFVSDTFVNASQLAEQVKQLQEEVGQVRSSFEGRIQQMQNELDGLRFTNNDLTETIAHVRNERDGAQEEVGKLRQENAELAAEVARWRQAHDNATNDAEGYRAQLATEKAAHDDAEYRAMHWEEQHGKVKAALDKVHAALGLTPTPEPVQEHPVQATGTGW